jgi:hypothetical protein
LTGDLEHALQIFSEATAYVNAKGLRAEVDWQRRADFLRSAETDLLREAAWVILCTGFRESVVRRVFDHVSLCFCDWESASAIVQAFPTCRDAALASFHNRAKLDAIVEVARRVDRIGFGEIKRAVSRDPINELQQFAYIGSVTAWHLAKNLGLDVPKPDRHLVRISERLGYASVWHLCRSIADATGEAVRVIDVVLWRYLSDGGRPFEHVFPLKQDRSS